MNFHNYRENKQRLLTISGTIMGYKTVSKNLQRWSFANENYVKERTAPKVFDYNLDFSKSLYFVQDFLKGIIIICRHCGTKSEFEKQSVKNMFPLDTKFHIIFSTLKRDIVCKICKTTDHAVYFEKIKLTKAQFSEIVEKQNKKILLEEQEKNRKKIECKRAILNNKKIPCSESRKKDFGVKIFDDNQFENLALKNSKNNDDHQTKPGKP